MLGYKSATTDDGTIVVITLWIPRDAIVNWSRYNIIDEQKAKYRTNKAKVVTITDHRGKSYSEAVSHWNQSRFVYKIGQYVEVKNYDMDLTNECAPGIHFFLDKEAAEHYEVHKNFTGISYHYYHTGIKSSELKYLNGKLHGKQTEWYIYRKKYIEYNYMYGKLHGLYQMWHYNGQKKVEYSYVNDQRHGLYQAWHDNGQKHEQYTYVNGRPHGNVVTWHDNGQKHEQYTYVNGRLHGKKYVWYKNGNKKEESTYVKGKKQESSDQTSGKKRKREVPDDNE